MEVSVSSPRLTIKISSRSPRQAKSRFKASLSVLLCLEVTKRVYFIGNERMLIDHDSNRLRFS